MSSAVCPGARTVNYDCFPVTPAFAVTYHKVQGATLGKVVLFISETGRKLDLASFYVGMTRVRNRADLRLFPGSVKAVPRQFKENSMDVKRNLILWGKCYDRDGNWMPLEAGNISILERDFERVHVDAILGTTHNLMRLTLDVLRRIAAAYNVRLQGATLKQKIIDKLEGSHNVTDKLNTRGRTRRTHDPMSRASQRRRQETPVPEQKTFEPQQNIPKHEHEQKKRRADRTPGCTPQAHRRQRRMTSTSPQARRRILRATRRGDMKTIIGGSTDLEDLSASQLYELA
jgi:hypothetical protein